MPEPIDTRVAVYIDFDNIVVSRYNQLHGARKFSTDGARNFGPDSAGVVGIRLRDATVDFGAVLDYASSFGPIVISRAYADWSAKANASYQKQLIDRAVDLTQLFPTTQAMKNGADIRLAVDVVEDLFRLDDLTHVVIVAGDSDYIALAQRCKRLGAMSWESGSPAPPADRSSPPVTNFRTTTTSPGSWPPEWRRMCRWRRIERMGSRKPHPILLRKPSARPPLRLNRRLS